jgi:RNA polymerase sigma factor (sigma-70 family)
MKDSHSTDAELVAATLGGSRESFGTLVERHQQFVCALAYSKTGSVATSEDIAQETFLSAWKNLASLRAPENFRGWLCGTTRNLAAKFHGRQKFSVPLTDDFPGDAAPSEAMMTREEEVMLWATLEQLPENYREPLVLFHRGGQSVQEIATVLEISEDAVKQRLSRGRAMLQEAVRAKVEFALAHSRPGAAFTIAVLAAIPALTTTAQAAGTGLAVAKGAGSIAGSGLFGMLGGLLIGVAGAWFGMKCSLDRAESARERRFIVRVAWWTVATISFYMAGLLALILLARPMEISWPNLWIGLMTVLCLGFVGSMFLFGFLNTRTQQRIRVEERLKRGVPVLADADTCLFEYRSPREFLGLPLVHIRLGGCSMNVAKGWMAYGNIAISPFLACGGIAIGPISMGGLAVGILATAGVGLGLFSFSGLAMGGLAIGGLAIGWLAIGGAAWGWLAAFGGQAWAGLYGLGRHVSAPHANDAVAKAFFHDSGLSRVAEWIASNGWMAQFIVFLPMVALMIWIRQLQRRKQS